MKDVLITSSALILALLLLRRLFRKTLSRRVQYALWGLVLIRLLVPVSLPAVDFSVLTAAQPVEQAVTERVAELPVYVPAERPIFARRPIILEVPPEQTAPAEAYVWEGNDTAVQYRRLSVETLLSIGWKAGIVIMGGFFALSNAIFYLRLRKRREPFSSPEPVSRKVYIMPDGVLPSPCLFGGSIYLTPAAVASPDALRHVLAHEETHARHLDPLWALLRGVCLAVYWFDPLVWVAAACSKADCELACDEGALKRLGEQERIPYGQTLLSLIPVRKGLGNPLTTATTMTAGKRQLRERVSRIAHRPKQLAAAVAAALVLVGVASACTFTGAKQPAPGPQTPATEPDAPEPGEPEPVASPAETLRYELEEIPFYEALSLADNEEVAILDTAGTKLLLSLLHPLPYDDPRFHEEGYLQLTRALEIFDTAQGRVVFSLEMPEGVLCAKAAFLDDDSFVYVVMEFQETFPDLYRVEVYRNGETRTIASGTGDRFGYDDPTVVSLGSGAFAYTYHDYETGTLGVNVVSARGEITPQITLEEDRPYYWELYGNGSQYLYQVAPYNGSEDDKDIFYVGDESGVTHQFSLPDGKYGIERSCCFLKDRLLFAAVDQGSGSWNDLKWEILVTDFDGNPLLSYPYWEFRGLQSNGNDLVVGNRMTNAVSVVRVTDGEAVMQDIIIPSSRALVYCTAEREFLLHDDWGSTRKLMRLTVE